MGNRPKIYVDAYRYIYRSDYNIFKHNNRYRHKDQKRTEEEIIELCHKYAHEYDGFKKGNIVTIKNDFLSDILYYGFNSNTKFEIMRIDYNGCIYPDIILVRPIGRYCNIPIKVNKHLPADIFNRVKE